MKKMIRRKYTDKFKDEAVKLVTEQGYKITETARNLDIHHSLLWRWIKDRSSDNEGKSPATGKILAELKRLKREILTKAVAFFVKESA